MLVSLAIFTQATLGTVFMIHGAGGGGWEYDKWEPVFTKAGWKVVAPDLVPSKAGLAKTTVADYVGQIQKWPYDKDKPLFIVGASMGGPLALKVAESRKVAGVILVNPVPPRGFRQPSTEVLPEIVKWAGGPLKDSEDSMPDSDRETILMAWKKWRDESGAVITELRSGLEIKPPSYPTLMLIGDKDTDISPMVSLSVAKAFKSDVIQYAGMSHVGPLLSTRATEVAQVVELWVSGRLKP